MRAPNDITGAVDDAAIEIHRTLGPALLESAYEEIMVVELKSRGLSLERQLMVPLDWKGHQIQYGVRVDLLVEWFRDRRHSAELIAPRPQRLRVSESHSLSQRACQRDTP